MEVLDPSSINLGTTVSWGTAIVYVASVGYMIFTKIMDRKAKKEDDKATADQAAASVKAMVNMTQAIGAVQKQVKEASDKEEVAHSILNKFVEETQQDTIKMKEAVGELILRSSGAMDKETSIHLLEKFFADLTRDAIAIFTYSIENNGYDERPDFIRDRVKTQLAQSIENTRAAVSMFKLSVPLKPFFSTAPNEQKLDRFILCDQLWVAVEPLYTNKAETKERVEEARLLVHNKIRDYLSTARNIALEQPLALTFDPQ
jgi:hypothetical protein